MGKYTVSNIKAYLVGTIRSKFYYSIWFGWLIRTHIRAQIHHRIKVMKPVCYWSGSCVECGCTTPALQMADKTCDGACYPEMMTKKEWDIYK